MIGVSGHEGEIVADQAHRGYTVCTHDDGYNSVNPIYMVSVLRGQDRQLRWLPCPPTVGADSTFVGTAYSYLAVGVHWFTEDAPWLA